MKIDFNLRKLNSDTVIIVDYVMQKPGGLVVVGQVKNGGISTGDEVEIQANGRTAILDKIVRIEFWHNRIEKASCGQEVGIMLKTVTKEDLVRYLD